MTAYYNEFDPKAAAWLRELIARGLIAPGVVDERSIVDVRPADLDGFTQCHFFAGIGVWSYALRCAGWPDDRPVWTGSCPCPPFSAAGKGQTCPDCGSKRNLCHPRRTGHFVCLDCGCSRHADERHLWPEFSRLIRERRPPVVFGEQVASADGRLWLDVVSADLRLASYGVAGADLCAAGVGAPHIRQRLWWVTERLGDALRDGDGPAARDGYRAQGALVGLNGSSSRPGPPARIRSASVGLADPEHPVGRPLGQHGEDGRDGPDDRREEAHGVAGTRGEVLGLEHAAGDGRQQRRPEPGERGAPGGRGAGGVVDPEQPGLEGHAGDGRGGDKPGWLDPDALGPVAASGELGGLALADRAGWEPGQRNDPRPRHGHSAPATGNDGGLADTDGRNPGAERQQRGGEQRQQPQDGGVVPAGRPGPTNGFWRAADWLYCRDVRWRPVEPRTFPLAHGSPARVGRLRGYGNAIVAPAAQVFIEAYIETLAERSGDFRLIEMSDLTTDKEGIFG